MNFKRCALRNDLKTRTIYMMSKGIDIGAISRLLDTEDNGNSFLDGVANAIEKHIQEESPFSYDKLTLDEVFKHVARVVDEEVIKEAIGTTLMDALKSENDFLEKGESMKWVNARGEVEATSQKNDIYVFGQKEHDKITLDAFISIVIEETEIKTAVRKAYTKACKEKGLTRDDYPEWLEETA